MKSLEYIYSILFKACSAFVYHQSEILRQKLFTVTAKFILWIFTETFEKNIFIPVAMSFLCNSKCKQHFISLQLNEKKLSQNWHSEYTIITQRDEIPYMHNNNIHPLKLKYLGQTIYCFKIQVEYRGILLIISLCIKKVMKMLHRLLNI